MAHGASQGKPSVGVEQLIQIGDTLRMQGKDRKAAEVYGWVLDQDPGNQQARQRLHSMPTEIARRSDHPGEPEVQNVPQQQPRTLPRPPTEPRLPVDVPPAPGVKDTVPGNSETDPFPEREPSAPLPSNPTESRFRSSSNLKTTVVFKPPTNSDDEYTIQIIPATKSGRQPHQRLKSLPLKPKIKLQKPTIPAQTPKTQLKKPKTRPQEQPTLQQKLKTLMPNSEPMPQKKRGTARSADETVKTSSLSVVPPAPVTARPQGAPQTTESNRPTLPPGLVELAQCVTAPGKHIAKISHYLANDSSDIRSLAAFLLGRAGEPARETLPDLKEMLKTERDGITRIRVAEAILRISPDNKPAQQILLAGLSASDRAVRWEAVCVSDVMKDHPQRSLLLTKVVDRLEDAEVRIQIMAALKLGEFKSDKQIVVPALEKTLNTSDSVGNLEQAARASLKVLRKDAATPRPIFPQK